MNRCAQVTLKQDNIRKLLKGEPLTVRVPAGADSVRIVIDTATRLSHEFTDILREFDKLFAKKR